MKRPIRRVIRMSCEGFLSYIIATVSECISCLEAGDFYHLSLYHANWAAAYGCPTGPDWMSPCFFRKHCQQHKASSQSLPQSKLPRLGSTVLVAMAEAELWSEHVQSHSEHNVPQQMYLEGESGHLTFTTIQPGLADSFYALGSTRHHRSTSATKLSSSRPTGNEEDRYRPAYHNDKTLRTRVYEYTTLQGSRASLYLNDLSWLGAGAYVSGFSPHPQGSVSRGTICSQKFTTNKNLDDDIHYNHKRATQGITANCTSTT